MLPCFDFPHFYADHLSSIMPGVRAVGSSDKPEYVPRSQDWYTSLPTLYRTDQQMLSMTVKKIWYQDGSHRFASMPSVTEESLLQGTSVSAHCEFVAAHDLCFCSTIRKRVLDGAAGKCWYFSSSRNDWIMHLPLLKQFGFLSSCAWYLAVVSDIPPQVVSAGFWCLANGGSDPRSRPPPNPGRQITRSSRAKIPLSTCQIHGRDPYNRRWWNSILPGRSSWWSTIIQGCALTCEPTP